MSPTLLEGVVIIVILVVAWQLGIRLAPAVLRAWQRAIEQLDARSTKQGAKKDTKQDTKQATKQKLLTKEHKHDQP